MHKIIAAASLTVLLSGCGLFQGLPVQTAGGASSATVASSGAVGTMPGDVKMAGGVLTDASGMTLYTFSDDKPGESNCLAGCARNWPPLVAPTDAPGTGSFTNIRRRDGFSQWAYKGMPLYTYAKDAKAGDKTGDNFNNKWKIAQ